MRVKRIVRCVPSSIQNETEPPRVIRHEREVPVRLAAAPSVVDVADRKRPAGPACRLRGAVEQGHGVGAARNREQQRASVRDEIGVSGPKQGVQDGIHANHGTPERAGSYETAIASERFRISSGDTSSMCVATYQ